MTTMLELPDITLVTMTGINIPNHVKMLRESMKGIKWGKVLLLSPENDGVMWDAGTEPHELIYTKKIPPISSIDEWNRAIIYDLGDYIDTKFAFLAHPDGYVVHPESWRPEFLDYDFIGAPWPLPQDTYSYRTPDGEVVRVGNSVSIRSKKLLQLPKQLNLEWKEYYGNTNEDGFITCHNRRILQQMGCRFAPIEVAKWFSRELDIPENTDVDKPFAFHRTWGRNGEFKDFETND